jgi:hypothetical protein
MDSDSRVSTRTTQKLSLDSNQGAHPEHSKTARAELNQLGEKVKRLIQLITYEFQECMKTEQSGKEV